MTSPFQAYRAARASGAQPVRPTSALDLPISVTFFGTAGAFAKNEETATLRELSIRVRDTSAATKAALPWLKLATFGTVLSERRSLRHDANVLAVHGIEADYDGGQITMEEACQVLAGAQVAALVYASPSHTAQAPRWRLLCPLSAPTMPTTRAAMVARVNGLFGGKLAPESFTLSQSYYYGYVTGNADHAVALIDGRPIDLASELDAGAIGRPERKAATDMGIPITEQNQHVAPVARPNRGTDSDGSAYGRAALERECDAVRNAPNGQKHDTLNKAAYSIGGLVTAGEVDGAEAFAALDAALRDMHARAPCKDFRAAQNTLRTAFADGKSAPRSVPEMPSPPPEAVHPAAPFLAKIAEQRAKALAKALPVATGMYDVQGALRLFLDHCHETSNSPQPFLALAAAICLVGVLAGRKYRTRTNLRSNIYAIGIADSGGGKDHARQLVKAALLKADLTKYLGGGKIASGSALFTALSRHPALLFMLDEFGETMAATVGPRAQAHKAEIPQNLKELYSSANSYLSGTEYADQTKNGRPRENIVEPHACLYATTTPGRLWAAVAGASLDDGLMARMLLFVSPESYPDEIEDVEFEDVPDELVTALQAIALGPADPQTGELPNLAGTQTAGVGVGAVKVPETDEAKANLWALRQETRKRMKRHEGTYIPAILARVAENAAKLALIRAVSRNPLQPQIDTSDVAWGAAVAEHCANTLLRDAGQNVAETEYERKCNKAVDIIRKNGGPITPYEMFRKGFKLPERERDEILASLVKAEMIAIASEGSTPKGGRPTISYVAKTPADVR